MAYPFQQTAPPGTAESASSGPGLIPGTLIPAVATAAAAQPNGGATPAGQGQTGTPPPGTPAPDMPPVTLKPAQIPDQVERPQGIQGRGGHAVDIAAQFMQAVMAGKSIAEERKQKAAVQTVSGAQAAVDGAKKNLQDLQAQGKDISATTTDQAAIAARNAYNWAYKAQTQAMAQYTFPPEDEKQTKKNLLESAKQLAAGVFTPHTPQLFAQQIIKQRQAVQDPASQLPPLPPEDQAKYLQGQRALDIEKNTDQILELYKQNGPDSSKWTPENQGKLRDLFTNQSIMTTGLPPKAPTLDEQRDALVSKWLAGDTSVTKDQLTAVGVKFAPNTTTRVTTKDNEYLVTTDSDGNQLNKLPIGPPQTPAQQLEIEKAKDEENRLKDSIRAAHPKWTPAQVNQEYIDRSYPLKSGSSSFEMEASSIGVNPKNVAMDTAIREAMPVIGTDDAAWNFAYRGPDGLLHLRGVNAPAPAPFTRKKGSRDPNKTPSTSDPGLLSQDTDYYSGNVPVNNATAIEGKFATAIRKSLQAQGLSPEQATALVQRDLPRLTGAPQTPPPPQNPNPGLTKPFNQTPPPGQSTRPQGVGPDWVLLQAPNGGGSSWVPPAQVNAAIAAGAKRVGQ